MHVELLLSNYADLKNYYLWFVGNKWVLKNKFISFKLLHDYYFFIGVEKYDFNLYKLSAYYLIVNIYIVEHVLKKMLLKMCFLF